MTKIYLKQNEINILKTVFNMLEDNSLNENKTDITVYSVAKETGYPYNTIRNKIKKIKDL